MTTLGPSLAIVLSGVLLTIAPWQALMWVFCGLTVLVLLAGAVLLRNVADLGRPVLDVASFLLVAVGLVGVLYGVSAAFSGAPLYAALSGVIGIVTLAAFILRQGRIEHPLLDLRPFTSTPFVIGVVMTMLGLLFIFAMNVVIPLYLQAALGVTPLVASLTLAPGILLSVVMGPIAGRLFDQHGGRISIPVGFLVTAVFMVLVAAVAGSSSMLVFGLLFVPATLAASFVIGPSQTFALSHLDRATSPHGVTVVSTCFQIAGCVGTSLSTGIYGALSASGVAAGIPQGEALLSGFRGAVGLVVVTSLIGMALALVAYRAKGASRLVDAPVAEQVGN